MIKELKDKIIKNLSDDLLKKEYINLPNKNRYTGHCYIASETYYHLSNENLKVYHIKHENTTHWFLKDNLDNIIDLTYKQFKTPVNYQNAVRGFFLTKQPSKRSKKLINKILND
jgi:outer membrane cobalamin receptor